MQLPSHTQKLEKMNFRTSSIITSQTLKPSPAYSVEHVALNNYGAVSHGESTQIVSFAKFSVNLVIPAI